MRALIDTHPRLAPWIAGLIAAILLGAAKWIRSRVFSGEDVVDMITVLLATAITLILVTRRRTK
jgi:hypothetical protein